MGLWRTGNAERLLDRLRRVKREHHEVSKALSNAEARLGELRLRVGVPLESSEMPDAPTINHTADIPERDKLT